MDFRGGLPAGKLQGHRQVRHTDDGGAVGPEAYGFQIAAGTDTAAGNDAAVGDAVCHIKETAVDAGDYGKSPTVGVLFHGVHGGLAVEGGAVDHLGQQGLAGGVGHYRFLADKAVFVEVGGFGETALVRQRQGILPEGLAQRRGEGRDGQRKGQSQGGEPPYNMFHGMLLMCVFAPPLYHKTTVL